MSAVYPTLPNLPTRDGIDDDDLTDIDDEVFIKDGKNGSLKIDVDGGVKRPLMAPRRKCKKSYNFETYRFSNVTFYVPRCILFVTLVILLISAFTLCMYVVNLNPMPMSIMKNWLSHDFKDTSNESDIVPCTSLATKMLWTRSLPKLISESPLRSSDVNDDGVEDIIVGFSTGLDMSDTPEYVCELYFEGQIPCFGGVLALNGKTGDTLWMHWTDRAIFSVDCSLDLTNDKIKDCIICGYGGILRAIDGHDGSIVWKIPVQELSTSEDWKLSEIYDAKFIADIDGDEIGDVIASHTVQSREIHLSEILVISGINGNIIRSSILPKTEQLFSAPQKLIHPDGENIFVFVTSSQMQSGALYVVPQVNLIHGNLKLRKLHRDTGKGTSLPPILVDITLDGIEDIIVAMFNSTVIAYDGLTFEPIWNYTVANSELISIPIPGYYNDDNIPDFMVKHHTDLNLSTFYYTVATIIDGKTGMSLLEKPIENSLNRQMSGLSVTVEGFGNDWFLYWSVDCLTYEEIKEKYPSIKNETLIPEPGADLCKLNFNSTLTTNLYALSQHVGPPGISLYFSATIYRNQNEEGIPKEHENKPNIMNRKIDETYKEYMTQKKFSTIDYQNDRAGNFNKDYTWQNGNKWSQKNTQTNKDYDILYDGESNSNGEDEQSMDYSPVDEVQERRSNINRKFNDYLTNLNMENNKDTDIKSTISQKRMIGFAQDNGNNTKESTERTLVDVMQARNHNFPNTIQNKEEDATIGEIFKQDSLKNQNKERHIKTKSNIFVQLTDKSTEELQKKKEIEEVKTKAESHRMYQMYGVQKQPPTGILLPSILKSEDTTSVDLVFSTLWLPPSEIPVVLVQEDSECRKKILLEQKLQYKESDHIIKECLVERGINRKVHQQYTEKETLKISFGQMTIHRMKLECSCPEDMLPNQSCENISSHQSWSEYLGPRGNGYFNSLHKKNT
ncbi:uncharacterized protein LOC128881821 [Hylaeus volcanicus]|uniref:uncharacterized protein LOC128881821 n=1 Tax=Hylaeus volcanicus TaxID=313075 RepID=UPI0023B7DFF6|nr:uncharacterized protein LOC128881821 [Hylaeus volcanicus]XP_053989165.1 uncharacterized protein LOC128881821 [Hylaeus volcanicus]XP_053989172.1 uncharacterized protein LOC128881821 [Hylaeus volcanicus]